LAHGERIMAGGRRVKCSVMRGAAALMELMMEFQG